MYTTGRQKLINLPRNYFFNPNPFLVGNDLSFDFLLFSLSFVGLWNRPYITASMFLFLYLFTKKPHLYNYSELLKHGIVIHYQEELLLGSLALSMAFTQHG